MTENEFAQYKEEMVARFDPELSERIARNSEKVQAALKFKNQLEDYIWEGVVMDMNLSYLEIAKVVNEVATGLIESAISDMEDDDDE